MTDSVAQFWTELVDHYNAVGFWHTLEIFALPILFIALIAFCVFAVRHDERHNNGR